MSRRRYGTDQQELYSHRQWALMWFAVARSWEAKGDHEMAERCRQNARLIRDGKSS